MDIEGLEHLLRGIEAGDIPIDCRELTEPSPLALEILGARPYAFLDDAPLEERRTRAVMARRWLDEESAAGLGRLDPDAIERVRAEAWPERDSADELHDALLGLAFLTAPEIARCEPWRAFLATLTEARRVTRLVLQPPTAGRIRRRTRCGSPRNACPSSLRSFRMPASRRRSRRRRNSPHQSWSREDALVEIVRGRCKAWDR